MRQTTMWDIYRTLSKHKLQGISTLQAELVNMSDNQLLKLAEDLAQSGEEDTGDIASAADNVINFCPIGGDLSLGNFEEVSRQLLLFANSIVLEEPLTAVAKHIVENGELGTSRQEFMQRLHFLVRQLLLIQPAVETDILRFVHSDRRSRPSELGDKIVHPQLDRVRRHLLSKVDCRQNPNGTLSFIFGKGSNQFISINGSLFTPPQFFIHEKFPSKERETSLSYGEWKFEADAFPVSSKLIESNWRAKEALDKAVNQVITRVVLGVNTAHSSHSNYMTDDPIEWEIIKLLSRIESEEKNKEFAKHAFAMQLAKELSFLENVALKDLLDLRFAHKSEFDAFRQAISEIFDTVQSIELSDWDKLRSIAKKTVADKVYPAMFDIKKTLESLKREGYLDMSVEVSIAALSICAFFLLPVPDVRPWLGSPPIPQLEVRKLERKEKVEETHKRPMYFLWEVMRSTRGK